MLKCRLCSLFVAHHNHNGEALKAALGGCSLVQITYIDTFLDPLSCAATTSRIAHVTAFVSLFYVFLPFLFRLWFKGLALIWLSKFAQRSKDRCQRRASVSTLHFHSSLGTQTTMLCSKQFTVQKAPVATRRSLVVRPTRSLVVRAATSEPKVAAGAVMLAGCFGQDSTISAEALLYMDLAVYFLPEQA